MCCVMPGAGPDSGTLLLETLDCSDLVREMVRKKSFESQAPLPCSQ